MKTVLRKMPNVRQLVQQLQVQLRRLNPASWKRHGEGSNRCWQRFREKFAAVIASRVKPVFAKLLEKRWLVALLTVVFAVDLILHVLFYVFPLPLAEIERPSATLVFDVNGRLLHTFTSSDEMWRFQTPLQQISPALQKYLLTYEDRWFYWHPGINPLAIARAMVQNLYAGSVISGGSTLTMQIARMIEPKDRTMKNKLVESFRALQLEHFYTKKQLLEIYFNIAPYGGNIEGAAAASWMYFGKEPAQLSYAEAALLAALPNNPSYLRPDVHPEAARVARDKVLLRMVQHGVLTQIDYAEALKEPVPERRRDWPFIAPHLSTRLHLAEPQRSRIYSTLDINTQQLAEKLLRAHVNSLRSAGITNGAVVVIDNRTHELKAMVGSRDFFDKANSGQVNGALAPRSPGSALKPFLYALGIAQGVITPAAYLEDVPINYNGYAPENYDRQCSGIVTVKDALERSLNIPAVNLNAALQTKENLYDLLKKAGVSTIHDADDYGLSLTLGGCEVNLLELSGLYSSFATGGKLYQTRELRDAKEREPIELFDAGTSFIITEILSEVRRPDLPTVWEFTSLPRVSWKTGTSYGHRDAWSIGYNPLYTIGVWIGNFNGEGAAALVGAEAAAPLLFDLMTDLSRNKRFKWFQRPTNVEEREVCSVSGQLPTENCTSLVNEYYLIDRSPTGLCEFHKSVLVDQTTGYRLPPGYKTDHPVKKVTYVKWPQQVATWRMQNGYDVFQLPELDPNYQRQIAGKAPLIQSPVENVTYFYREGVQKEYQKIAFTASVSNDVQRIYWFLDGKMIGSVKPGEKFFYLPEVGKHKVICQDDLGRMQEIELVVE